MYLNGTNGIDGSRPTPPDEAVPLSSVDLGIFDGFLLSLFPPGLVLGASPEELESIFYSEIDEHDARFVIEDTRREDNNGGRKSTVTASGTSRVEK